MNAKRASRRSGDDDGAPNTGRLRPNPMRQAIYAVIVLGAISAGYLVVTLADAWKSGEVSSGVIVSLPIAEKKPRPSKVRKTPPTTQKVAASVPAIFPDPNEEQDQQARPYEESLPTEVYVPTPPPPVPGDKSLEKEEKTAKQGGGETAAANAAKSAAAAPAAIFKAPNPRLPATTTQTTDITTTEKSSAIIPDRPMIAIVIDDMGVDRRRSRSIVELQGPLTVSFLTYAENLESQTAAARAAGHELLLHLPMEPGDHRVDPGPNVLLRDIEPDELRRRLDWGLSRFHGYVGVNNHMGSKFTADRPSMAILMGALKRRNVFFLDSRTSSKTVGSSMARQFGVPIVERNVFLDNENDPMAVKARLAETERLARIRGVAIAIGHPRDGTLAALSEWLPTVGARGFELVSLSNILARRQGGIKPDRVSSSWRQKSDSSAR